VSATSGKSPSASTARCCALGRARARSRTTTSWWIVLIYESSTRASGTRSKGACAADAKLTSQRLAASIMVDPRAAAYRAICSPA
jgi:hypothetical protein